VTAIPAPPIDTRTAAEIARDLDKRLAAAVPGWSNGAAAHGAADALIQVAARFAAIVLERVNRVPDRQRLAFLAAAGAAPLPPQAATVPVTFALAPGTTVDVIVPAGTRVASADEPGRPSQVFETDRPLVASATRLDRLYVRDPAEDRYADRRALLSGAVEPPVAPFRGDRPIEHSLAIGHRSLFGLRPVQSLSVTVGVVAGAGDASQRVVWETWDGVAATTLTPVADSTAGLLRSGVVVFRDVGLVPAATVDGRAMRWLRARLAAPIVRPTLVNTLTLQREVGETGLALEAGTSNGVPLDLTKDFLPFGPQPRFGDTCHIASAAAFSLHNATVTLSVALTQDAPDSDATIPPVNREGRAHVLWEFWNGTAWVVLGRGRAGEDVRDDSVTAFSDTTRALTHSGEVSFRFVEAPRPTTVAGVERHWIRARLTAGHYGQPPSPQPSPVAAAAAETPRAAVAPPMIRAIVVTYRAVDTACAPDAVVTSNDFEVEDVGDRLAAAEHSVAVFRPTRDRRPAMYFGFEPPVGRPFAGQPFSLYLAFGGTTRAVSHRPAATASPSAVVEYWREHHGWTRLSPYDGTGAMTRSGTVVVLPPKDCLPTREFGDVRYWIRVLWRGAANDAVPPLRRVLANTTDATQASTRRHEILGSSHGTAGQVFRLARTPVLEGACIDVHEGARGTPERGWMSWTIVADLLASGPLDRHVVVDHAAGTVTFGDGRHGRIPPAGDRNVRAAMYRSGGGAAGNVPARRIVQLKSPIPSIASVVNEEPAMGGGDGESVDAVIARAPRAFRHGQRAVTISDYEDLALLASTEVARARCVPLCDLAIDPEARHSRAGTVSVIVVPRGVDDRPMPALALLDRVHRYLAERQNPLVDLTVVGPEYVAVDVEASVRLRSLHAVNEAELAIRSFLSQFLHPVSGGRAGEGWDFGREPHRSDLFALIGRVAEVDHVEALRLVRRPEEAPVWRRQRFLVSPGTITLFFYA
jgi:hypothetical protein